MSDISDKLRERAALGFTFTRCRELHIQAADTIDALTARVAELEGDLLYIGSKWPSGLYTDHFKYDNGVTRLIVWLNEKEVEEIKRIATKEPTQ